MDATDEVFSELMILISSTKDKVQAREVLMSAFIELTSKDLKEVAELFQRASSANETELEQFLTIE